MTGLFRRRTAACLCHKCEKRSYINFTNQQTSACMKSQHYWNWQHRCISSRENQAKSSKGSSNINNSKRGALLGPMSLRRISFELYYLCFLLTSFSCKCSSFSLKAGSFRSNPEFKARWILEILKGIHLSNIVSERYVNVKYLNPATWWLHFNFSFKEKESRRDSSGKKLGSGSILHFTSEIEHIEEQMARDNVHFVRFETTDIHGVSRSKSIPSRFFRVCLYSFLVSWAQWPSFCNSENLCYCSMPLGWPRTF